MTRTTKDRPIRGRKRGRRSPLASIALLAIGLLFTGGAYALFSVTTQSAQAQVDLTSQQTIEEGSRLFAANCATCHGMNLQGTSAGPTLVGVGAAAVDFQVGTGRMPLQQSGPQAVRKPPQFDAADTLAMAAYVHSVAPGPDLPDPQYLELTGNATAGAELFRINCAMCHNVAGAGGALTEGKFAPALDGVEPVHIYEAMVTGPQNMPVFNDQNLTPEQKRDIITALKYSEESASAGGFTLGSLGPVSEGLFAWLGGIGVLVAFCVWLTARSN